MTSSSEPPPFSPVRFALAAGVLLVVAASATVGFRWGRRPATAPPSGPAAAEQTFVVAGGSMAPTLRGPHRIGECQSCVLQFAMDDADSSLTPDRPRCPHCGETVTLGIRQPGDRVVSEPVDSSTSLQRGDLVVLRPREEPFLKRLIGLPGDTITIAKDGARLLLNGNRIEDFLIGEANVHRLPWILVDRDTSRAISRWQAAAGWTRDRGGRWSQRSEQWLVYHHRNVYRAGAASAVLDDYPYNAAVSRALEPVDRLRLSGSSSGQRDAVVEVVFWTATGARRLKHELRPDQRFVIDCFGGAEADSNVVTPEHPIALRGFKNRIQLASLQIERLIEYRLRPRDDRSRYPITLSKDQIFVLGDNVPVSIDSRNDGPFSMASVVGRVIP